MAAARAWSSLPKVWRCTSILPIWRSSHDVERDDHGNVRIAELNIGEILKQEVSNRLKQFGLKATLVAKNIGYELRCADPVPADMEYTRDLGYCAAKYLLSGGNGVMISMQGGHFVPIPFEQLLDPNTGRARIRMVDIRSTRYAIARRYMIRLRRDDFNDPHELAKFAATAGLSLQEFRKEFDTSSTTSRRQWCSTRSSASSNRGRITRIPIRPCTAEKSAAAEQKAETP